MGRLDAHREGLCREFLASCYARWDKWEIDSQDNLVSTYLRADKQYAYCVMYFAKYVGCWAALREAVDARFEERSPDVVSLGAGPLFCLLGWQFERPPAGLIRAIDVLDWRAIRGLVSHRALCEDVLGTALDYREGVFFPDERPPQCSTIRARGALDLATGVPEDATVLLPMVLNHLVGAGAPMSVAPLASWLRELEQRAGRIVIADMPAPEAPDFWSRLRQAIPTLGDPPAPFGFEASSARFERCYPPAEFGRGPEGRRRTGLRAPQFCRVTACVFDRASGWHWLT